MTAPIRLCCGQAHSGAVCPDGKVMCCLCFNRYDPSDLNLTTSGKREDVCTTCAADERAHMAAKDSQSAGGES